jgi:hypothetical protein
MFDKGLSMLFPKTLSSLQRSRHCFICHVIVILCSIFSFERFDPHGHEITFWPSFKDILKINEN